MKGRMLPVLLISLPLLLAPLTQLRAEEPPEPDFSADALKAPGDPPVIPHPVKPNQDGEECNVCHRVGIKGAPPTDHPERLNCTSCHVQGAVKAKAKGGRTGRRK